MLYTIEQVSHLIGARRFGTLDAQIDWLLTDSRSLVFPEGTLFFALSSKRQTGASYIQELIGQGVSNFVLTDADYRQIVLPLNIQPESANFLVVSSPLKALQKLAEQRRRKFDIPVIGITGSNGKTIVKEWLHQILCAEYSIVRSPRSYNSQIGVPLSVWALDENVQLGIFEAGISKPGEMIRLQSIIAPTIGVLTNIGSAHQENFYSEQEKCMEKLLLFKGCDVLIYDGDNELIASCVSKSLLPVREIAWSRRDRDRPLFISDIQKGDKSTTIVYSYLGMENRISIPFVDDASVENAIHCLAVALYLMLPHRVIEERMSRLEPVAMRLEVKEGNNDCMLINDSYNSDVNSLNIALNFMQRRSQDKSWKRVLILSDILETGKNNVSLYRQVSELLRSYGVDRLIGVGHEITRSAERFDVPEKEFFPDTHSLVKAIKHEEIVLRHSIVLIKGARCFGFDELTDLLEKKVHETILEVNLGSMVQNLDFYRSRLNPETKTVCMVKASAYGTGSYEVAKTLQDHRVDYLAVAVADEGSELRKAGITSNIIIMNPEMTAFKTLFDYRLEPEVYNFHLLEAMIREAEKEGVAQFPIHIKIDTGMHRLGFSPDDMPRLVEVLQRQRALLPRSVFSHFVGSDSPKFDAFTHEQFNRFNRAASRLQEGFSHHIIRHICNTAGITRFANYHMDMVRLGLGLYGIDPVDNRVLHNVSTLRTTILQLRDVPAEETVGYSRKGHLTRPSRIAAIPIGYADGLNRHLGNGNCYCLVNGKPAPYVGNICMDVCMIDVTDIPCKEGDSVEIFGDNLPITVLSNALDTIPYEVLSTVSPRVKRVYFQD